VRPAFELLATLCAGLFAGGALYINFVEHPARMECGAEIAATLFGPSYRRASKLQASLAVLGFIGGVEAWYFGAGGLWLAGAILLGSVVPFTVMVVMPVNLRLMRPAAERPGEEARRDLERWGRLHAVRTGCGLAAFFLFLYLLGREPRP
jgi:hypothetical protein